MDNESDFVKPLSIEQIEQSWAEQDSKEPPAPAPPMANVGLALELCSGANSERDFQLQGKTYRLKPTSYPQAIRLQAWAQALERYEGMMRADPQLALEHLPELRECYQELAEIAGSLLVNPVKPNPFLGAERLDFHRLLLLALDPGDETLLDLGGGGGGRHNTAYHLLQYLAHFGSVPGMVVLEDGRPSPASWRHYLAGMAYLRRSQAEEALWKYDMTTTAAWGDETSRASFKGMYMRETGRQ